MNNNITMVFSKYFWNKKTGTNVVIAYQCHACGYWPRAAGFLRVKILRSGVLKVEGEAMTSPRFTTDKKDGLTDNNCKIMFFLVEMFIIIFLVAFASMFFFHPCFVILFAMTTCSHGTIPIVLGLAGAP